MFGEEADASVENVSEGGKGGGDGDVVGFCEEDSVVV